MAGPSHGTLTLNANGSFAYTPSVDFNGTDSFTYRAKDAALESNLATVTLTIRALNDAPVNTVPGAQTTDEDTSLTFSVAGANRVATSDVDAAPDDVRVALGVAHGTLTLSGTTGLTIVSGANGTGTMTFSGALAAVNAALNGLVYAPAANYNGPDELSLTTSDLGHNPGPTPLTDTDTVAITVTAVNDRPVAVDDDAGGTEDTDVVITKASLLANDTDVEGEALSVTVVGNTVGGTVEIVGANVVFHPAANLCGNDIASFDYTVADVHGATDTGTVTIDLTCVNDSPVAQNQAVETAEDVAKAITLGVTDPDGAPPTITIVSAPTHGTLTGSGVNRTYTPAANYNGPDSFTFRASDGASDSNVATVSISVTPVNDVPVAADNAYATQEDTPLTVAAPGVLANDTDVEGSALTSAVVTGTANGTIVLNSNGSFIYTPAANFSGVDSFTYRASDGATDSNVATVTITVNAVNDPPTAANDSYATDAGTTLTVAAPGVLDERRRRRQRGHGRARDRGRQRDA